MKELLRRYSKAPKVQICDLSQTQVMTLPRHCEHVCLCTSTRVECVFVYVSCCSSISHLWNPDVEQCRRIQWKMEIDGDSSVEQHHLLLLDNRSPKWKQYRWLTVAQTQTQTLYQATVKLPFTSVGRIKPVTNGRRPSDTEWSLEVNIADQVFSFCENDRFSCCKYGLKRVSEFSITRKTVKACLKGQTRLLTSLLSYKQCSQRESQTGPRELYVHAWVCIRACAYACVGVPLCVCM